MIQELYQKALKFAGEKHANQQVPDSTANYLLHISNVVMEIIMANRANDNFDLAYAVQVGILHDTLEDTETDYEEIAERFGADIAKGVLALTKNSAIPSKRERMMDSLKRINQEQQEVGIVKIADRITNLQQPPRHWSHEKIRSYWEEAKIIADKLAGKNEFLNDRLLIKINDYKRYIEG